MTNLDPVTLEPMVAPAISLYGHTMGSSTWQVHPLESVHPETMLS